MSKPRSLPPKKPPVFDQQKALEYIRRTLPLFDDMKSGVYIPGEIVGEENIPLFCEVTVNDKDLCEGCKFSYFQLEAYGFFGHNGCCCDNDRSIEVTYRIVSVVNYQPNVSKPQYSAYDVQIRTSDTTLNGFDLQSCLERSECNVQFSIQDSIDEYTGNPAKEMVTRYLANNLYRVSALNFNQKLLALYTHAYDELLQKIFCQPVIAVISENPHVDRKKK